MKLLLHSCCAPCSTQALFKLKDQYEIIVYYYNPNIEPLDEYEKRKKEQIKLLDILHIKYIDSEYENALYNKEIKSLSLDKEGGSRCQKCITMRLEKTALMALKHNIPLFTTTLTVSPYKDSKFINSVGEKIALDHKISFLSLDLKKENGYLNSIELSKKYDLYRQHYCGCLASLEKSLTYNLVSTFIKEHKTISIMESCTGGYIANEITNIKDSSKVFSLGLVTYSLEAKYLMGVNQSIITKDGVYSQSVANEMSRVVAEMTKSTYGIGITGTTDQEALIFVSIYDNRNNIYYNKKLEYKNKLRSEIKNLIWLETIKLLEELK